MTTFEHALELVGEARAAFVLQFAVRVSRFAVRVSHLEFGISCFVFSVSSIRLQFLRV